MIYGKNTNRSIIDGSLSVLAFDDMKPPAEQINAILDFVKSIEKHLDDSFIKGKKAPYAEY